jgi:hypothetical protein
MTRSDYIKQAQKEADGSDGKIQKNAQYNI